MATMLVGSIDLNKIDKNKIVKTDKNGQPFQNGAKYLSVVVWINDEVDQYGNIASIQESISKEEREAGVKPTYIGNLKNIHGQPMQNTAKEDTPFETVNEDDLNDVDDDLPF